MKRREFITLLGGAAAAWPLAARAQQPAMPVIGILSPENSGSYATAALRQGLSQAGYVEGRNVVLEYHWADGQYDRLPALAADLVRRQVSVIYTFGLPAVAAAKAATATIPIVFQIGANPVEVGLVASLTRPGGNITGVTGSSGELSAKRLELLHEAVPAATVVAALINPTEPNAGNLARNLQAAAGALGLEIHLLHASTERDFDTVFTTLRDRRVGALVISPDAFLNSRPAEHAALLRRDGVPTISPRREFAVAGGLMSYVPNDMTRAAGIYTGRILKGEKPADLPVQQATKIELIINLKTAEALGITFPTALLVRADEVIES
jgi:putative tryptophan/tyrosine transport system substrate-binding protein